jgi:glycosyltransferase involved in cell wall biosynthesis
MKAHNKQSQLRAIIASLIGNTLEWFDYTLRIFYCNNQRVILSKSCAVCWDFNDICNSYLFVFTLSDLLIFYSSFSASLQDAFLKYSWVIFPVIKLK